MTTAGIVLLVVLLALAAAAKRGKIDTKLLTEAGKSLGYRWQYWQATSGLIRDRFWTGTGPGNFRGHYLGYKVAESSEEIADPHNLLLEVWATSGALAAIALVAALVAGWIRMARSRPVLTGSPAAIDWGFLLPAGIIGFAVAWFLSDSDPLLYGILLIAWGTATAVLGRAFNQQPMRSHVFAWAVLGISVHLLGAGGIAMPAVAQNLWVLMALGLNASEAGRKPSTCVGLAPALIVCLVSGAAVFGFVTRVLEPVTASRSALTLGQLAWRQRDLRSAERYFQAAARRDPLSAEPHFQLSRIHYQAWQEQSGSKTDDHFQRAVWELEKATTRAPVQFNLYKALGDLWRKQALSEPRHWTKAIAAYRQSVAIYPSNPQLRFTLGDALWHADRWDEAALELQQALELDRRNPHPDKGLTPQERAAIQSRRERTGSDLE